MITELICTNGPTCDHPLCPEHNDFNFKFEIIPDDGPLRVTGGTAVQSSVIDRSLKEIQDSLDKFSFEHAEAYHLKNSVRLLVLRLRVAFSVLEKK